MARIRTLKPEYWTDEKLGPLPPLDRLVFLGLISQADDAGRRIDSVKLLDGLLFPYTDDTCGPSLDVLDELGRVQRYADESGRRLLQVVGWAEHQKVKNPSAYVFPPPPEDEQRQELAESSVEAGEDGGRTGGEAGPVNPLTIPDPRSPIPVVGASHARTRGGEPVENPDPLASLVGDALPSIRGLYGGPSREGTDAAVWREANGVDREKVLEIAALRLMGEGRPYHSMLFRKVVLTVITEQRTETHDLSHWEETA
jgi:hypothetical protein